MKTIVFLSFLFLSVCASAAGVPTVEQPINGYGTPTTVAVSTTSFTKVPTSQTSGRFSVYVSMPVTNTASIVGHFGNCSSTSIANSVAGPIQITTTTFKSERFDIREDVCLWLLSLSTSASSENIHYQETKK